MSTARAAVAASAERLLGWLAFVGAVAAWQVVATMGEARSVASFGDSARALVDILWGPDLADHVLPSLGRVVAGFGVTALVGIGFGLLLGTFHGIEPWVRPVIEFLRAVPPPLIVPVAMMIMGLSGNVVITVIVFGTLWPVLINTLDGASRVEPLYLDTARVFRSPRWVVLRSVVLPASLPTIMAGLRTALSISLIMLVLGEMLASSTGIGYLILTSQQTFDVPATYGGVLLLGLLGWTFDTLFVVIERRVLRWNSEFSGGSDV
ncbi:MAG TPA: ABC transporter permease [Natronosporangium sp.]|nr:ABC transporter permease [Natronosporangium sp.]